MKYKQKKLSKLYNWTIKNQNRKLRVPSEGFLFIKLLAMIISGKSPLRYQRHLIGYTWIEKKSPYIKVCENIYKNTLPCYRYTKENKYFYYIRQTSHSL